MKLFLHSPETKVALRNVYRNAFNNAVQIYIVSAYLTEWDCKLKLNGNCRRFRIIIGKDFGITKKDACKSVMKWLPKGSSNNFLVTNAIDGFHPKAVFWEDSNGRYWSIIGSSNLTNAAFEHNYEANAFSQISQQDFNHALKWISEIEKRSIAVSEDWLAEYNEQSNAKKGSRLQVKGRIPIPAVKGMIKYIRSRRKTVEAFRKNRKKFISLFNRCRSGRISSDQFYAELNGIWSWDENTRIQGKGWERHGKIADFQQISTGLLNVIGATNEERDNIVELEINQMENDGNPARRAFFSEMLCLLFPELYPIDNDPVAIYLKAIKFRSPRGISAGERYVDLSKKLRIAILEHPKHPAKNLAELDTVIWLAYHDK